MKKLLVIMVAMVLTSMGVVNAQKVGHISSQEIMKLMPEAKKAQDSLDKREKDALETLKQMEEILMKRIEEYKAKANDPTTPKATLAILEDDIREFQNRIQVTQEQFNTDLQNLESALLNPIVQKIKDAVAKVSAAQGINYVFDTQLMFYQNEGNDLNPAVKKELGIQTP